MATAVRIAALGPGVLQDTSGHALVGRQVYVYLRATTTQATVYVNSALSLPLSQPLITGINGALPGYLSDDTQVDLYDVTSGNRMELEMLGDLPSKAALLGTDGTVGGPSGSPLSPSVVNINTPQTLSNKRNTKRVITVAQSATPVINTDNADVVSITGLAQAITSMTANLTGTPNVGDSLIIGITDNGTAQVITWGASFEASTVALPITTVVSTLLTVGFLWNAVTSKWRCVAVA